MRAGKNISLDDGYRGAEHCISKSGQSSQYVSDPVTVYIRESLNHELLTAEQEVELGKQIQAGVAIDESLRLPEDFRGSSHHREWAEARLETARGALDQMVNANMRLAAKVATRYTWSNLGYDELIHEGVIGLITAAKKFDPDKGFKFSTYAVWWIRQSIGYGIANTGRFVRVPARIEQTMGKVRTAMDADPERPLEDICAELELNPDLISHALNASKSIVSLDMPLDKNDDAADPKEGRLVDKLADRYDETLEYEYDEDDIIRNLKQLLAPKFPRRSERMTYIIKRNVLEQAEIQEVAKELGVSGELVRQLRLDAVKHLQSFGREVVGILVNSIDIPEDMPAYEYGEALAKVG